MMTSTLVPLGRGETLHASTGYILFVPLKVQRLMDRKIVIGLSKDSSLIALRRPVDYMVWTE